MDDLTDYQRTMFHNIMKKESDQKRILNKTREFAYMYGGRGSSKSWLNQTIKFSKTFLCNSTGYKFTIETSDPWYSYVASRSVKQTIKRSVLKELADILGECIILDQEHPEFYTMLTDRDVLKDRYISEHKRLRRFLENTKGTRLKEI